MSFFFPMKSPNQTRRISWCNPTRIMDHSTTRWMRGGSLGLPGNHNLMSYDGEEEDGRAAAAAQISTDSRYTLINNNPGRLNTH